MDIPVSVVGIFDTEEAAHSAVNELHSGGLGEDDVSLMVRDAATTSGQVVSDQLPANPYLVGAGATGALIGGLIGIAVGWMVAIGAIPVLGANNVIGAGVLGATIVTGALGVAIGGLIGALAASRIPQQEIMKYEHVADTGRILLTVHPKADLDPNRVLHILESHSAYDVRVYGIPSAHHQSSEQTESPSDQISDQDESPPVTDNLPLTTEGESPRAPIIRRSKHVQVVSSVPEQSPAWEAEQSPALEVEEPTALEPEQTTALEAEPDSLAPDAPETPGMIGADAEPIEADSTEPLPQSEFDEGASGKT